MLPALYGVPVAFFLFANMFLAHSNLDEHSTGLVTAYYYAPFIMAAGIGFFPLTLIESGMVLFLLSFGAAIIGVVDVTHGSFFSSISHFWLLVLVGIVGTFSAMSQLQFHVQTIEKSTRDALTGLTTRGTGAEILGSQIQIARRKCAP